MPDLTIQEAARILMAHSLEAARLLARPRPDSPIFQQIYNRVAADVLSDPQQALTPQERALVAQFVDMQPDPETRSFMLHVRLTEEQRAALQDMADRAGLGMSEYVRSRLFDE